MRKKSERAPLGNLDSPSRGVDANRHETMEELPATGVSRFSSDETATAYDRFRQKTNQDRTKYAPQRFNNNDRRDLYFVRNPHLGGIIKIGIAGDVAMRVATIEMAVGVPLELLAVFSGLAAYERHLHCVFDADRLHGEWFAPTPELLELIAQPDSIIEFLAYAEDRRRCGT